MGTTLFFIFFLSRGRLMSRIVALLQFLLSRVFTYFEFCFMVWYRFMTRRIPMRIILRNKTTGLFFQGVADWTGKPAEAFDFQRPERVVKFVLATGLNLSETELVFAFEEARYNIALPVDARFGVGIPGQPAGINSVWQATLSVPSAVATQTASHCVSAGQARSL
jgi:hypothetical protein